MSEILLGYEIPSGKEVLIPVRHMCVTGQTQESGKTTTLEALIARSERRAIAFVTKRVYVIEASDDDQFGRIALLVSEGFFDSPKKIEHINKEFIVRGWAASTGRPSPKNLDMAKLAEYGFVLVVGAGSYQSVPGMKVNVKQVSVVA